MNFKPSYLFPALCAVAALSAFSGTASAAGCDEIQNYVNANRAKVATALFEHYGDSEKRVKLGKNDDNFSFMTIKNALKVEDAKGCTVRISVSADKNKNDNSNPNLTRLVKRDGSVKLDIGFLAESGTKLCVTTNRVASANWRSEGAVREKIFVKHNRSNPYFSGCLF